MPLLSTPSMSSPPPAWGQGGRRELGGRRAGRGHRAGAPGCSRPPAARRPLPAVVSGSSVPRRRGCQDSGFPAAQDVSSPSPYLVKVFQGSVIQLRGAQPPRGRRGTAQRSRRPRSPPPGPGAAWGARAGPGDTAAPRAPPAPLRRPPRAAWARSGPRPDGVTFPVHSSADSSPQRGSDCCDVLDLERTPRQGSVGVQVEGQRLLRHRAHPENRDVELTLEESPKGPGSQYS